MGKVVPFKRKPASPEEESLRQRLQTNPDDLEALTELFLMKVEQGQFDPTSDYARGILRSIETVELEAIKGFLQGITPIVEAVNWSNPSPELTMAVTTLAKEVNERLKEIPEETRKRILSPTKYKHEIYENVFRGDNFLDCVRNIVPINDVKQKSVLGATDGGDLLLKDFIISCFKSIISKHGLLHSLICLIVFSSCPILDDYSEEDIEKLIRPSHYKFSEKKKIYRVLNKITEYYLTFKLNNNELSFLDLFKLLALRYSLKKDVSDVCNRMLDVVAET